MDPLDATGIVTLTDTIATGTANGALIVGGGVGVAENVNIGGNVLNR